MTTRKTLGTWKLGTATITASWFDHDAIRVENSAGGVSVHTAAEWSRMHRAMLAAGYTR
jgi:hypothetical protein